MICPFAALVVAVACSNLNPLPPGRASDGPTIPAQNDVPPYKRWDVPVARRVDDLLRRMTLEEKARQLDMYHGARFVDKRLDDTHTAPDAHVELPLLERSLGNLGAGSIHDLYPTPEIANAVQRWVIEHNRLGVPVLFLEEGVHGYSGFGETVYPCSINLASTFDALLAQQTGAQIGAESRANGVDMILGPVLDVAREPRWGRIEEDFGEDPYLSGAMGAAYVEGMQGESLASDHSVVSEPKHFAGHGSPEGGINTSPVHAGEREVRSVFLRSFEPAIRESHARGVMAAYHEIDGVPCAGNPWLLTDVLRGEWGFGGFVLSDLGAISELYSRHRVAATEGDAVRMAIRSGVDMQFYDFDHPTFQNALVQGVRERKLSSKDLDRAVGHVLAVKFELGLFDHPYVETGLHAKVSRRVDHLATSLQSARESMCLLKNEGGLLPLSKGAGKIAVIGPNAVVPRMGDYTPGQGVHAVPLVDAVKSIVSPQTEVTSDDGHDVDHAVALARGADVVIIGLGERDGISGEGADRAHLDLPDNQEALLEALVATKKPVVLVLLNGRPLAIPWAASNVPAILEAWYPGEFGSAAIAETLFGDNNPAGRLPISFPTNVGAIPVFYNHDPSKGDRYVDGSAVPLWPFGHGLSYTTFRYGVPRAAWHDGAVDAAVDVTNTGGRDGDDVVQLYLRHETSSVVTPVRELKGFRRIHLRAGETQTVLFRLGTYELEVWGVRRRWEVEPGKLKLWAGGSSATENAVEVVVPSR